MTERLEVARQKQEDRRIREETGTHEDDEGAGDVPVYGYDR
jgi:hypothetical protein